VGPTGQSVSSRSRLIARIFEGNLGMFMRLLYL